MVCYKTDIFSAEKNRDQKKFLKTIFHDPLPRLHLAENNHKLIHKKKHK
jgi:hypothetical protein